MSPNTLINNRSDIFILLYDGICGLCNKFVQLILDHDHQGTMYFATLQSKYGQTIVSRYSTLKNIDSVILVKSKNDTVEKIFVYSDAVLQITNYLGGIWKIFLIVYLIPKPIRNCFYKLVAKNRYKIFGNYDSCKIPSKEVSSRFLE